MMELKRFFFYLEYAAKIISVIILIYFLYLGYLFFTNVQEEYSPEENVAQDCNRYVNLENYYEYCCVERSVEVKGNFIEASCYSLKNSNLTPEVHYFECSDVVC